MAAPAKKYRRQDEEKGQQLEEDDDYVPYVPVKERKKQQLIKLGRIAELTAEAREAAHSESRKFI